MRYQGIINLYKHKLFLLITLFLVFGVVITVFIGYRTVSKPQELILSSLAQDDATIAIDRVHQTSTKNGIKEWSLDAVSAQFIEKNRQLGNWSICFVRMGLNTFCRLVPPQPVSWQRQLWVQQ